MQPEGNAWFPPSSPVQSSSAQSSPVQSSPVLYRSVRYVSTVIFARLLSEVVTGSSRTAPFRMFFCYPSVEVSGTLIQYFKVELKHGRPLIGQSEQPDSPRRQRCSKPFLKVNRGFRYIYSGLHVVFKGTIPKALWSKRGS